MGLDCKASLTITGPKADLENFTQLATSYYKDHPYYKGLIPISMERLLPFSDIPEKTKSRLNITSESDQDWKEKYYGAEDLLCFGTVGWKEVGPDLFEYGYGLESKGVWPKNFIFNISKKFPAISFHLSHGNYAYMGHGGTFECKDGKVIQDSWEEDVWSREG